jgi:hypothetical protein
VGKITKAGSGNAVPLRSAVDPGLLWLLTDAPGTDEYSSSRVCISSEGGGVLAVWFLIKDWGPACGTAWNVVGSEKDIGSRLVHRTTPCFDCFVCVVRCSFSFASRKL